MAERAPIAERDLYAMPMVYDMLHARGTAAEVDGLERIAARFSRSRARRLTWLEPACGTGRYLRVLAGRGARAIGFDGSEAMIAYARRRVAGQPRQCRPRLVVAEMERCGSLLPAGSVDIAFNLINTIRHLPTDAALRAHLSGMRRLLRAGGVYLVGLSLTAYGLEGPSEDVWRAVRGRCRVRQVVQYVPPTSRRQRDEQVYSVVEIRRGRSQPELICSRYALRCYDRAQWEEQVARAGLGVLGVVDEAGRDVPAVEPGYVIYVLGRAASDVQRDRQEIGRG